MPSPSPRDTPLLDSTGRETVRTVAAPLRHEIDKIRGSRFLASLEPVSSAEEAMSFVEERREEFRDATHNCFAWRLGADPEALRFSDDGEPSGTAGRPILAEIDGRRLTDVVVVVTRWYGGTKLGTGGLLRAYGAAAAAALDRAQVLERWVVAHLSLRFSYSATGPVQGVLAARGLQPVRADYGSDVWMELAVPVAEVDAVRLELRDATQGACHFDDPDKT